MTLLLYLFLLLITQCQSRECEPNSTNSEACETLFRAFEDALLANGSNLYNLRRLFYPPSSQLPELANITYYVKLGSAASGESAEAPYNGCEESVDVSYLDTGIRYGWTTIGIYTFIHPALLNQLQVQLPFAIMKINMRSNTMPDIEPFLWDGYSHLPSAGIHLNVLNLTCPPPLTQVDKILKTITSLLKYYALSERKLGTGRLTDAYYALDGKSVSTCNATDTSDYQYFPQELLFLFYTMCAACLIAQSLVGLSTGKFIQQYEHTSVVNHQSLPLLIGFLSCMFLFTISTISTEIWSFVTWTSQSCNSELFHELVKVKFYILIGFIVVSLLFPLLPIAFILIWCNWNKHTINHYVKFTLTIYLIVWLFTFVFLWVMVCLTATLLLALAYPLYMFTLIFIHVAFMFLVTVAFGIAISQVASVMDRRPGYKRYIFLIIVLGVAIAFLSCAMYAGVLLWYKFTIVKGFSNVEGASAVVVLLPSLVLALFGRLVQRRFFADTESSSPAVRRIVAELVTLNFNIVKRRRLGQLLGIPVNICETIELAVSGKNEKRLALTKIINYWLSKNEDASLQKLADVLLTLEMSPQKFKKPEMSVHEFRTRMSERIRMLIGDNYLKKHDIEPILETLSGSVIPDSKSLAKEFNMLHCLPRKSNDKPESRLRWTLETWIGHSFGYVTWNHLIDHMNKVDPVAAKKIKILLSEPEQP